MRGRAALLHDSLDAKIPTTNQAAGVADFRYDQTMTIGLTGPERKAPRQSAVVGLIIAAVVAGICLFLLWLASDFLVDWLWFSSIGYPQVFWTTIGAKAVVLFAVWTGTAVIVGLNGWLAVHLARRQPTQSVSALAWNVAGHVPPSDLLTVM